MATNVPVTAYQQRLLAEDQCPVAVRRLPPWIFPPASARNLIAANAIIIPAIGAGFTDIVRVQIDRGKNGVIKWFSNQFVGGGFTDGSGSILWRLLIDNRTVPGLESIAVSLGTNQVPREIAPVRLLNARLVQLQVSNVSIVPAGQIIEGSIAGWLYPEKEEPPGMYY
ncbi:MAG TPA: hypothetical protein VKV15_26015 [Bryobacteraceae bacterium]|jgi:hypothetical protein|nr:hypothetical protein [Bryobacteraceae bacterium]